MQLPDGPILEAGCGKGRIIIYYHKQHRPIMGMDFITSALSAIKERDNTIPLISADIKNMPFIDDTFSAVLAFGLYHNLHNGLDDALQDTHRILKNNGVLCASTRMDNIQNYITDIIAARKYKHNGARNLDFHKLNLKKNEIKELFEKHNFSIESIEYVENMPFLYKFRLFRHHTHRKFDEKAARMEGYRLSTAAKHFQYRLIKYFPHHFCNLAIITVKSLK